MILNVIFAVTYYILVIAWILSAITIISLWIKLLKLRHIKKQLRRKDDET